MSIEKKYITGADVPAPPWLPEELSKALLRAGAAEDKLSRVREWYEKSDFRSIWTELDDILDGED